MALAGSVTFSEKLPLISVPAPCDVPGTMIVAPISGAPLSSTILPVTVDCATAADTPKRIKAAVMRKFSKCFLILF